MTFLADAKASAANAPPVDIHKSALSAERSRLAKAGHLLRLQRAFASSPVRLGTPGARTKVADLNY